MALGVKTWFAFRVPADEDAAVRVRWVALGIVAVFAAWCFPLQFYGSLVMPVLQADEMRFGWSPGIIGVVIGCFFLIGGFLAPLIGEASQRLGDRRTLLFAALLYGAGTTLLAVMRDWWLFLIAYGVVLSLVFTATLVSVMGLAYPWFRRSRGLAVGIVWTAGALGGCLFTPLLSVLLRTLGWTWSFLAFAVAGSAVMLALTLCYPATPERRRHDRGTLEDNAWINARLADVRQFLVRRQLRRTRAYWMLPVVHGLGCGGHAVVLVFLIDLVAAHKFGYTAGAVALTIVQFAALPSRLLTPIMAERIRGRIIMFATLTLQGIPALGMILAHDLWVLFLLAALFGLGYGGESTVYPVINRRYFGDLPLSSIYGRQIVGARIGSSLAIAAAGLGIGYYGRTFVWVLAASLSLIGAAVVWMMESTTRVLVTEDGDLPGLEP